MGDIIGRGFDMYVQNQVIKRQEKLAYGQQDIDVIKWNNTNNAFLRLSSGVDVSGSFIRENLGLSGYADGNALARHFKLFAAQTYNYAQKPLVKGDEYKFTKGVGYSFNSSYGFASPEYTSYGLVPPPGITSATIKSLNRGSLREATVNIKCHNLQQFQIIEVLYLRLKYTLLLEWGHSLYFKNDGTLVNSTHDLSDEFLDGNISQTTVLRKIQNEREESNGNYDAFFGLVTNFDWTVTPDGGYDINMIARAAGDVIESLKINSNIPASTTVPTPTSNANLEINAYKSTLNRLLWTIAVNVNDYSGLKPYAHGLDDGSGAFRVDNNSLSKASTIPIGHNKTTGTTLAYNEASMWNFVSLTPGWMGNRQSYIKLGTLLRIIESFLVFYNPKQSNEPIFKIDFDFANNFCFTFPRHVSIDPRVCLIPYPVDASTAKLKAGTLYYEQEKWVITKAYFPDNITPEVGIYSNRPTPAQDYDLNSAIVNSGKIPGLDGGYPTAVGKSSKKGSTAWVNIKAGPMFSGPQEVPASDPRSTDGTSVKLYLLKDTTQIGGKDLFGTGNLFGAVSPKQAIADLRSYNLTTINFLSDDLLNVYDTSINPNNSNNFYTLDPAVFGEEYITWVKPKEVSGRKVFRIQHYGDEGGLDYTDEYIIQYDTDPRPVDTFQGDNAYNNYGDKVTELPDLVIERYEIDLRKYNNDKASGIVASSTGINVYKDLKDDNKPGFKDLNNEAIFSGRTMEIRVNMEYIAKTLSESTDDKDGNANLYTFLKKLLSGVQNALGNVNNFEIVYNEDTNTFKIIDNTLIPGLFQSSQNSNKSIVQFLISAGNNRGNDGGSFVYNMNFRTKLSNAFATMATIGAQANGATVGEDATALSRWNVGLTDRIIEKRVGVGPEITEETDYKKEYIYNMAAFQSIVNKTNEATISDAEVASARNAATDIFKTEISAHALKNQKDRSKGITPLGFIPFDLELNMKGLSGPRIYESYTIDTKLLPKSYQDSIQFICSGISHTITNGEWKTTLNSICGPKQEGSTVTAMSKADPAKSTGNNSNNSKKAKVVITSGPGLEPIQKVVWNAESLGGDPNIYNYGQYFVKDDPRNCLRVATISPSTPNGTTKYYKAGALDLSNSTIKQVLQAMRKYNGVGVNRKEINPLGVDNDCPATGVDNKALFASGLYQFTPGTLYSNVNALSKTDPTIWDWKFNAENQTKLANSVLFLDGELGNYLAGKNNGDKAALVRAINATAGIWASLPLVPKDPNTKVYEDIDDVTIVSGGSGAYVGQGGKVSIQTVAQALITSRIQYCAANNTTAVAPHIPPWYVKP
jgi:hypothetical protein